MSMRFAISLGLTGSFELEPAFLTQGGEGGYRNSPIPNYVTRWREIEIEKIVYSMYPTHRHTFEYFYGLSVPVQRFRMSRSFFFRLIGEALAISSGLLAKLIGKQGNSFGFLVLKNTDLQPWIKIDSDGNLMPDAEYLANKYDRIKYK